MFVPHHQLVTGDAEPPASWMFCLHGVFGSGANWRTFARRLVAERPDWGVVLVDLRCHGRSRFAPPPHTMETAAQDLVALAARLDADDKPVRAVCGHSLGGKVALRYTLDALGVLDQCWVIDSSPSRSPGAFEERDNTVVAVLRMLGDVPREYANRKQFVDRVVEYGFPAPLAQWLAMNVEYDGGRYRLVLDTAAIRDLLVDYYERDLWPAVELGRDVHAVIAGKSSAVTSDDRARFVTAGATTHVFDESGHWVHIEALDRLVGVVSAALGRDTPAVR